MWKIRERLWWNGKRKCRKCGKWSNLSGGKRLIEVAKSQRGWKREQILPDTEVSLFDRMCCCVCFCRRWYPWELIRANVDTDWVIHVDQCSETIAPSIHLPRCSYRGEADLMPDYMRVCLPALPSLGCLGNFEYKFILFTGIQFILSHSMYHTHFKQPKIAVVLNESVWITLQIYLSYIFLSLHL